MPEPKQKPGRSKQDYSTPWELIRAVEGRWGKLDVDLAARADNAKVPLFVTPEQDSLKTSWIEIAVGRLDRGEDKLGYTLAWLNPPFARIGPWAAKCVKLALHTGLLRIVMLTPASVGANWFRDHVHNRAMVYALNGRITFEGTEDPYPKDCMLSLFGFGMTGFDVWTWK